jgi:hypothetical protein
VEGVPSTNQLRPITLLSTDYKIATKVLVGRLSKVLPSVLTSGQLCSNTPKNILFGASNILSTIDYINQNNLSGYLLSFDIFKAYDKTTINFVIKVMEKMNFGENFCKWIETCHRDITTCFILKTLSRDMEVNISIRQGDPLAMPLFLLNMEPFLQYIRRKIRGVQIGRVHQRDEAYVDDTSALSTHLEDMRTLNAAFLKFEAVSGTVLNRKDKSKVMGLGDWAGKEDWPLPWINTVNSLKIFGIVFHPTLSETITASWNLRKDKYSKCLLSWQSRNLPTLSMRVKVLKTYAMPILWYIAQVLPLPGNASDEMERMTRTFLWRGRLEKLTYEELFNEEKQGGLGLPSIATRANALFITQLCRVLKIDSAYRDHLSYWIGLSLRIQIPGLRGGLNAQTVTPYFRHIISLLKEVIDLNIVNPDRLEFVRTKIIYKELMSDPPPPKILSVYPGIDWERVFKNLMSPVIPNEAKDLLFSIINNIYKTKVRLNRMNLHPTGLCRKCGVPEDFIHVFTNCDTSVIVWPYIKEVLGRVLNSTPLLMDNVSILFLNFTSDYNITIVIFLVSCYIMYIHECRINGNDANILSFKGFLRHKISYYTHGRFPCVIDLIFYM